MITALVSPLPGLLQPELSPDTLHFFAKFVMIGMKFDWRCSITYEDCTYATVYDAQEGARKEVSNQEAYSTTGVHRSVRQANS